MYCDHFFHKPGLCNTDTVSYTHLDVYKRQYIDYSGPYPRSKSGNTMLSICVDSTKFVWMYPMRRALAYTTIKILQERLFKDCGTPLNLISDNGPQFKSKEFNDVF